MSLENLRMEIAELKQSLQNVIILQKKLLTVSEAATYMSISKSTLYKLIHNGKLPHYKPGNKLVYFKREELDQWITQSACKESTDTPVFSKRRG